jgi:hypothetical protein
MEKYWYRFSMENNEIDSELQLVLICVLKWYWFLNVWHFGFMVLVKHPVHNTSAVIWRRCYITLPSFSLILRLYKL